MGQSGLCSDKASQRPFLAGRSYQLPEEGAVQANSIAVVIRTSITALRAFAGGKFNFAPVSNAIALLTRSRPAHRFSAHLEGDGVRPETAGDLAELITPTKLFVGDLLDTPGQGFPTRDFNAATDRVDGLRLSDPSVVATG